MKYPLFFLFWAAGLLLTAQNRLIDAALAWDQDVILFFKGNNVVFYNNTTNKIVAQKPLLQAFPGLTFSHIDAALDYTNGKIYFFCDGTYTRFDRAAMRADAGYPRSTASGWANLPLPAFDAAVSWPNGKSYFFAGNQYVRYDRARDATDEGYPRPISPQTWPGLGFGAVDAAVLMPNGKMYVFCGNQYVRYDVAADRADPGYPKSLDLWVGLQAALTGNIVPSPKTNPVLLNNELFNYSKFNVIQGAIDLTPYTLQSPNRVTADFMLRPGIKGQTVVGFQAKNDGIILRVDAAGRRTGNAIVLKNYWLSDIYPMPDGSLAVLAGKDVNNDYIPGYPNALYFINISKSDVITTTVHIFGGEGHGPGKSWFDGRSRARIACNGQAFGVYFEVQKNFARTGQDIHNGDMFVATTLNGQKKPETEHFWTASHSNTVQVAAAPNGEFWTMTIGDAGPYGLQVFNRNRNTEFIAWPPKEDYIPYEQCQSSNAAGLLRFMDVHENSLIALLGTLDHPNIGVSTKVDPLFLRIDMQGNVLKKKYLRVSATIGESNISAYALGENYVVAFGPGNVYENGWQAGQFEICVIDRDANFIFPPTPVPYPFDNDSEIVPVSDREVGWCTGKNGAQQLNWYRLQFQ